MKPRKHNYANAPQSMACGGKVKGYADGGEVRKKASKKKKVTTRRGDTNQSTNVGSTSDTLRNRRAQQMADLGLKDGGRVQMPGRETRQTRERPPMPNPKKGPTPRRIGRRPKS